LHRTLPPPSQQSLVPVHVAPRIPQTPQLVFFAPLLARQYCRFPLQHCPVVVQAAPFAKQFEGSFAVGTLEGFFVSPALGALVGFGVPPTTGEKVGDGIPTPAPVTVGSVVGAPTPPIPVTVGSVVVPPPIMIVGPMVGVPPPVTVGPTVGTVVGVWALPEEIRTATKENELKRNFMMNRTRASRLRNIDQIII
jgi:hypothetical protein